MLHCKALQRLIVTTKIFDVRNCEALVPLCLPGASCVWSKGCGLQVCQFTQQLTDGKKFQRDFDAEHLNCWQSPSLLKVYRNIIL